MPASSTASRHGRGQQGQRLYRRGRHRKARPEIQADLRRATIAGLPGSNRTRHSSALRSPTLHFKISCSRAVLRPAVALGQGVGVEGHHRLPMEDALDLYAEAPDPRWPVVCFDESPVQLIGEVRQPIPAEPGQLNVTIASTAATALSISSSASTCIGLGARSRSPSGERQKTTPNACANLSMSIIPMLRASGSSRTTCSPTRPALSTRHSHPPKPGEFYRRLEFH